MNKFALNGHKVKAFGIKDPVKGFPEDRHNAVAFLEEEKTYTVSETHVGSFFTIVFLKEFPGIRFGHLFFKDVTKQRKEQDKLHQDYYKN